MRIATWNVNSLKARLPRVEEFLGYADVDVLCLQETKLADKAFPALTFSGARLRVGALRPGPVERRRDPVARRHRRPSPTASATRTSIPYEGDARVLAADVRRHPRRQRVRAERPRGRRPSSTSASCTGSQSMHDWLDATHTPDDPLVVLGDFNVAPEDRDVWDPKKFVGATHVTEPERKAVARLEEWGLDDAVPARVPGRRPALQLLGLPRRRLPPAPRHAHRPRARRPARSPSASRGPSSTATPARAPVRPTTRR